MAIDCNFHRRLSQEGRGQFSPRPRSGHSYLLIIIKQKIRRRSNVNCAIFFNFRLLRRGRLHRTALHHPRHRFRGRGGRLFRAPRLRRPLPLPHRRRNISYIHLVSHNPILLGVRPSDLGPRQLSKIRNHKTRLPRKELINSSFLVLVFLE